MLEKALLGKIFISYSSKDRSFVRSLTRRLWRERYSVWLDEKELVPGDALATRLSEAIEQAKVVLVIVTPNSVASNWVKFELNKATERMVHRNCRVVPVLRGDIKPPAEIASLVYADFRTSFASGMSAVFAALRHEGSEAISAAGSWAEFESLLMEVFKIRGTCLVDSEYKDRDYNYIATEEIQLNGEPAEIIYEHVADYSKNGEPLTEPWWNEYSEAQQEFEPFLRLVLTERPWAFPMDTCHPESPKVAARVVRRKFRKRTVTHLAAVFVDLHQIIDRLERLRRLRQAKELLSTLSKEAAA
jgi:hypothetical protein